MKALLMLSICLWSWQAASSACPPCASDEFCNDSTSTCDCDLSLYQYSGGLNVQVNCLPNAMEVVLSRCQLEKDLYNSSSAHFADPACQGVQGISENTSVVRVEAGPYNGTCGNFETNNGTHVTISNTLTITTYVDGFSQSVSISCTYDSSGYSNNYTLVMPMLVTAWSSKVEGFGNFSAQMALYRDATLNVPVNSSELLYVADSVYIGVEVPDLDESMFSVLVKSLFATPVADPNSALRYDLITEGCPNNIGVSFSVKQNGLTKMASFEMSIFKIVGYESYVLFADLYLCDRNCTPRFDKCGRHGNHLKLSRFHFLRLALKMPFSDDWGRDGSEQSMPQKQLKSEFTHLGASPAEVFLKGVLPSKVTDLNI